MDDIEAVQKDSAPKDMDDVVGKFFNDMRDLGMPEDIIQAFKNVALLQQESARQASTVQSEIAKIIDFQSSRAENEAYYAENLKSHTIAVREFAFMLKRLNKRNQTL